MKKPKKLTQDQAVEKALAGCMAWAAVYGRIDRIAETMTAITGGKISRQMVGRWLNPNPEKRVQPGFGNGLILIRAVAMLENGEQPDTLTIQIK